MNVVIATLVLAITFIAGPSAAQGAKRLTVPLNWEHLPRTGDALVLQAAKVPGATVFYSVYPSRNRVIRIQWDGGIFCKGVFAPGESPHLECGVKEGHYRLTQEPGQMPRLEWVEPMKPPAPKGEPG